ncbi:uncharacterized protein BCR38DRAFT_426600 [Pseudomassariella vexata]|uniref:Uncharacterized protein n=1 Tax=Pseudomassariella vexata TaxID=1141098 RepID=A0A1Y2E6V8_9PEZI|nr:uncharacterized protein BCR38DRAFT_426600 [Pseudomassariella vexata]ORY67291.1 hypothetical protein BCR38DRAFT_426600 [Pseudomassariella vexata]
MANHGHRVASPRDANAPTSLAAHDGGQQGVLFLLSGLAENSSAERPRNGTHIHPPHNVSVGILV